MQALPQFPWLRCLKSIIDFSPLMVAPETSVLEAISLMAKRSARILVVTVSQMVGWLTEQDIVNLLASGVDFQTTKVSEVMHTSSMTLKLSEFQNLATALLLLSQNKLVFLPIVGEQGQLVGTVTPQSICRELVLQSNLWAADIHPQDIQKYFTFNYRQCFSVKSGLLNTGLHRSTSNNIGFCTDINIQDQQAYLASESSERKFRAIFNGTFQFTWLLTLEGILVEANQIALDFGGLEPESVVGHAFWETHWWRISPETQTQLKQAIAIASQGEFIRYEVDVLSVGQTVGSIEFSLKPLTDDTGKVLLLIAEGRDITDLKQTETALQKANLELEKRVNERTITLQQVNEQLLLEISERQIVEEQLRQSQEILQLVLDNIPQFIFWKDRNFVFLGCNRNFARIAGVESPEDIIGKTDYDLLINHKEADLYREFDARIMQTDTPEYQIIEPLQRADGQQVCLETNKVPLHDTRGNVIGILASFEEITERQKTQKALEQSEERFRFLAESIPQQVWIAQVSGSIEYVNQRTIDYFDCNWQQILDWEWQQWLHPEDLPKYMIAWQKSLATGEPFEMECRWFRASDQTYRWHLARALPLHDQIGKIINWFGTNTDIHDHVSAEVALRESEEWFRNLAEARSDWVWEVDENAVYTYVSPKVRDILGYEPEAVLGKTPFEFMPPEEAKRVFNVFAPIAAAREPLKCLENINIHQDGHLVVLETTGIPVFDLEGKFRGYRGTDRDITVRQQADRALQETQQRLQAILDNSSAVIYVVDTENQFLLVNHKFEHLFRTTQDQLAGKSIYDIWPPDIADEFAANNHQVVAGGIPIEVEEVVPQEDGLHTYLSVKSPLKDADGVPYAVCGISTDITDRKVAEESLLRFCQAIESTSDAICMADVTGKPIYVNSGFTELYEYALEEFQAAGGALTIFQHPAELQKVLTTIYRDEPWRGEVTMRSRSGRIVQIYLRADAIKDSSGKILGTVATHTDVTQRRQAEEGLRLRDRAIAASSNGIIIADASIPNWPIIYVNPAFEYMTGYSAAEVIGQNFHLFQSTDVNQLGLQKLSTAMQEGKDCAAVLYNYRKDGSILWIELNISPVYDTAGILTHYIGIQTDITERKQAEIALLVSQQRLQYLLDSSPAVIYTSKPFGDFGATFVSENVSTVLGYEAREMIENFNFWASHIHPEDLPHVFAGLSKVLDQGQYKLEYRFLHKDGNYRWLYDKGKLLRDDTGNPLELVGYLAEITDRKQLEQELRVALEKEKELGELKSRFVSMTSHEFRTPLSTILSSSELLEHYRQKWTEEKQLTHLHRIQAAVKRMTDMLNDVLIIGKVEAGRLEFRPKSFDLVAYCRHLVAEMQLNLNNQRVTKFIAQDEFVSCCMDDKLLGHILGNLLSNAIKYSPPNSAVEFTLTCQNGQAKFEIQDWGIGIPPEDLPRLFESFYRAHNVGNILGTGLGLAIVKRCVDIHQGTIFVTSTLGVSTLFTVTLPLNNEYIN